MIVVITLRDIIGLVIVMVCGLLLLVLWVLDKLSKRKKGDRK